MGAAAGGGRNSDIVLYFGNRLISALEDTREEGGERRGRGGRRSGLFTLCLFGSVYLAKLVRFIR